MPWEKYFNVAQDDIDVIEDGTVHAKVKVDDLTSNRVDIDKIQDGTTNKLYTATEKTKLTGIEEEADVTADHPPQAHDLDAHNACSLAELNAKVSDVTLIDTGDSRLSDARTPTAHKTSHQNGESDEISVAGLSGELADNQPPKNHASNHTDGTDDIQTATAGQKGLASSTQITKLDGIEEGADVTDQDNVIGALSGANTEINVNGQNLVNIGLGSDNIESMVEGIADNNNVDFIYRTISANATITNGLPSGWIIMSVHVYNTDHDYAQTVKVTAGSTTIYNDSIAADSEILELGCCDLSKGWNKATDEDIVITDNGVGWQDGIQICIKIERFYKTT